MTGRRVPAPRLTREPSRYIVALVLLLVLVVPAWPWAIVLAAVLTGALIGATAARLSRVLRAPP